MASKQRELRVLSQTGPGRGGTAATEDAFSRGAFGSLSLDLPAQGILLTASRSSWLPGCPRVLGQGFFLGSGEGEGGRKGEEY